MEKDLHHHIVYDENSDEDSIEEWCDLLRMGDMKDVMKDVPAWEVAPFMEDRFNFYYSS